MKHTYIYLLSAVFSLMVSQVLAGGVTIPNTFTAGTPAKAAEGNDNFNAVKTSVDDNDARINSNTSNISNHETRITANETNKQNRVIGTCGSGSSIRIIDSNGSVTCQPDTDSGGDITGVIAGNGLVYNLLL